MQLDRMSFSTSVLVITFDAERLREQNNYM